MKTNNIEENKWQVNNMIYVWWSSILQCSNVVQGLARILSHWQEWIDVSTRILQITRATPAVSCFPVQKYGKTMKNCSKPSIEAVFSSAVRCVCSTRSTIQARQDFRWSSANCDLALAGSSWRLHGDLAPKSPNAKALGSAPGVKNQQSSQTMSDLYQIYLHLSYLSYIIYIHIYLWVIKSKSYQVVLSTVPTML